MEPQGVQSTIIICLSETKEFDEIKVIKGGQRHNLRKLQTHAKTPTKQSCSYCGSSHPPRQWPAYGRNCVECGKVNHFTEVSRNERNRTIHDPEQEPDQHHEEEDHINIVNINSIIFNSKWSVITANLKTLSKQVSIIAPYKVDTGSDGNIMPLHIYIRLFPRETKEQLVATKSKNIQLKTYDRIIKTQMGICKVKLEHIYKQKCVNSF